MKETAELLGSLLVELPQRLGSGFEILEGAAAKEFRNGGSSLGDVFIRHKASGEMIILEVKGSKADDELPFGVLPGMRRANRLISPHNSKIMLISTSIVSPTLRDQLTSEGITVVERPSPERVVEEIRSIAEAGVAVG